MRSIGVSELLIVLLIILVLFGASRLPQLARSLGQSMKEFRNATRSEGEDEKPGKEPPRA